jgi:hypothetical protein
MSSPAPQQHPENVLAPKRLRREEAGRTDHEERKDHVTTTADTTDKLTLGQIWQRLSPLTSEAWSQPIGVTIHSDLIAVSVQFQDNDRAAVDGAYFALNVVSDTPQFNPHFIINHGKPGELRDYGNRYGYLKSPLLPGIQLALFCQITTNADPWAHGDAFGLPPRPACLCCGSRDCISVVGR